MLMVTCRRVCMPAMEGEGEGKGEHARMPLRKRDRERERERGERDRGGRERERGGADNWMAKWFAPKKAWWMVDGGVAHGEEGMLLAEQRDIGVVRGEDAVLPADHGGWWSDPWRRRRGPWRRRR